MKRAISSLLILMLLVFPATVFAMGSANYHIDADVINSGGGESASDNFSTFDSIGESFIGSGLSGNYALGEGFEATMVFGISLSLDSAIKDLGAGLPGSQLNGATIATVTTDAWGGYNLYISKDKELTHTDNIETIASIACAIVSPCAWPGSGFGFTVNSGTAVEPKWGSNPNYDYAAIPMTSTVFHSKSGYTSGADATTVGYRVEIPIAKQSGIYSNQLTYMAVAAL